MIFFYNAVPATAAEQIPDAMLDDVLQACLDTLTAVWENRPLTDVDRWVAENTTNYAWLAHYCERLHDEKCFRFGSLPNTWTTAKNFRICVPRSIPNGCYNTPMPSMFGLLSLEDTALRHQTYLLEGCHEICTWTRQTTPGWYKSPYGN